MIDFSRFDSEKSFKKNQLGSVGSKFIVHNVFLRKYLLKMHLDMESHESLPRTASIPMTW